MTGIYTSDNERRGLVGSVYRVSDPWFDRGQQGQWRTSCQEGFEKEPPEAVKDHLLQGLCFRTAEVDQEGAELLFLKEGHGRYPSSWSGYRRTHRRKERGM